MFKKKEVTQPRNMLRTYLDNNNKSLFNKNVIYIFWYKIM